MLLWVCVPLVAGIDMHHKPLMMHEINSSIRGCCINRKLLATR
jgi:hypothetical protein